MTRFIFFYRYVPVQTLKLSKLRARQIAEPKLRLKYPKKISIATEDSSLTLLKNDLPWTLHPLPPPLPTAKTIKLEVDKSMPWALHPLPPPVKTKNYSDYYWPDSKTRPKYYYKSRPSKSYRYINNNNYKYKNPKAHVNFKPTSEYRKPAVNYKSVVDHDTRPDGHNSQADHKPTDYNSHVIHKPADYNSHDDHKPADYNGHDDHKPVDYNSNNNKPDDNNYNHAEYSPPDSFKYIDYKHIDYKHLDYKSPDYKSPDYKSEYPKHSMEEEQHEINNDDDHYDHNDVYHHSHDDHSAQINDSPSPSSQPPPPSAEYVSHITIEPSIQIAAFSETELQGDGSNRDTSSLSQGDSKHRSCQCTINAHRHKRDADNDDDDDDVTATVSNIDANDNRTAFRKPTDSKVEQSSRNAHFAPRIGHATDVQIIKSHDITEQSMINGPAYGPSPANDPGRAHGHGLVKDPGHAYGLGSAIGPGVTKGVGYVQRVRNMNNDHPVARLPPEADRGQAKKNDAATFRDESDKFKVDFGRDINAWDESKSAANKQGRYSLIKHGVRGESGDGNSGFAEDYGNRPSRNRPDTRERGYHVVKSKVENSDRGVSFSVQTPFSVSSFSSNVRHPEERQSRFRYTGHKSESSPSPSPSPLLSSFRTEYAEPPLDFEQFGLKSALSDDHPLSPDFTRDLFEDKQPESVTIGGLSSRFSEGFGVDRRPSPGFSGRPASHFSRDFSDDNDDRSRLKTTLKPFRYNVKHGPSQSVDDLFDTRPKGGRQSNEESVLEYFQPVVIDFDKSKQNDNDFKSFGGNNNNNYGGIDKSRYFGKTDTSIFAKFRKNQNSDQLRLPGRLHESNENLSRKMLLHPSTFDID